MSKMICLNPTCDYCIDQVEFEASERCPKCEQKNICDAELKKYQPLELINELKRLRDEGKILKANIINKETLNAS